VTTFQRHPVLADAATPYDSLFLSSNGHLAPVTAAMRGHPRSRGGDLVFDLQDRRGDSSWAFRGSAATVVVVVGVFPEHVKGDDTFAEGALIVKKVCADACLGCAHRSKFFDALRR
jgi:hypothetical protein